MYMSKYMYIYIYMSICHEFRCGRLKRNNIKGCGEQKQTGGGGGCGGGGRLICICAWVKD